MIKPLALPGLSVREQLAAKQIDTIQSSTLGIEPKDGDSQFVGSHPSEGTHAVAREDQPPTTVSRDDICRTLNELDFHVPSVVIDPTEIAGRIQVAGLTRATRRNSCIRGTEVVHPFSADLDRFIVRCSPWSWLRRISHRSRVHPSSDKRPTRSRRSMRSGLVGGKS